MAPARLRVAAGAGLFAASLSIVGPGIAAVSADPGGSGHGHSKPNKDSGRGHGGDRQGRNRGSSGDGRQGRGNDQDDRRGDRDSRGDLDRGGKSDRGATSDVGGKSDVGGANGTDGIEDVQVAARSIASVPAPTTNSLVAEQAPQAAPAEAPAAIAGGGSGGAAQPAFVAPKVTFGNGRAPGVLGGAGRLTRAPEPIPLPIDPAAAGQWSPAPAVPPPTTAVRELASQRTEFIDRVWAPLHPAFPGGLVFGIAGLVVAPLAGVWIGYRQARGADAADQFADR
ncbi:MULTISPECIES: hypothetical protein [unclassified Mycobacterium]|uniref:hypothetical protein n=1 Tax=unclassified Mycobacterium TaxID=2642494 RepID=UPI0029C6BF14|nr:MULTISPECIES: hypothetical protein [unclassified Mycobacterium]